MRPPRIVSRSEEQTAALAARLARLLKPGDVVFLKGPLGAGKTFFIRAAARQLGVTEPVTSPSFAMGQTYAGRVTVHHLDLYRLTSFDMEDFADFEPFFEKEAITFIEWPERAEPHLSRARVVVNMDHIDEHSRDIRLEGSDSEMSEKLEEIIARPRY
ncbi:MAG: tRNA (adenosine(37)-N6)-threonylcarbamoyltransferase complex ATPase subunit type 1 TsaE [Thermoleophilia bacterium]|nr:tRNA (adenosine(37)-N6)-threonylcarbamoyltransferase complex ATPase subunit type 1 TsaE [Thermoleophilia bacterium]